MLRSVAAAAILAAAFGGAVFAQQDDVPDPEAPLPIGLATGQFEGVNGFEASGTVDIVQTPDNDQLIVTLSEDFEHSGGEAVLAFDADAYGLETYAPKGTFGEVAPSGEQAIEVPKDLGNVGLYNELWLWDQSDEQAIGVARLERAGP